MLYVLLALLNFGLFLFFVFICFRATKLVRENLGLLAAIIFVFGLLSFNSSPDNNKDSNFSDARTWEFTNSDSLYGGETFMTSAVLEKTPISKYVLSISYGRDKQRELYVPASATSSTTGFISGTSWKPSTIKVDRTNDNTKFAYYVNGVVEWRIFGLLVYIQPKNYKGFAEIK